MEDKTKSARTPRAAESREKTVRAKPWRPPSLLDAPEPPAGYVYRWIRESKPNRQTRVTFGSGNKES